MVNLRIPGPTPCPPDVLAAMARQMINHRSPEFAALNARVRDGLRPFFQTTGDILILTASGTGALEAAIVNTLSPGERVLAVTIGAFGDRFATIAETYGANVTRLPFEWGQAANPDAVQQALRAQPGYAAVLVTHNDTSTAVTNPLAALCAAIRAESDALILADAVSSLGSIELQADAWGVDVVATASQKGFMTPPGLAMLSLSDKAWRANQRATMPRFYLDARKAKEFAEKGETPWTPALSIFYGLDVALEMLRQEGREAVFARHQRIAAYTRAGMKELGLALFADERYASEAVTGLRAPEGIDGKAITKLLREKYQTVLGGGQGKLAGQIFRVGHMGWVYEADIDRVVDALKQALPELGYALPAGARAPR